MLYRTVCHRVNRMEVTGGRGIVGFRMEEGRFKRMEGKGFLLTEVTGG